MSTQQEIDWLDDAIRNYCGDYIVAAGGADEVFIDTKALEVRSTEVLAILCNNLSNAICKHVAIVGFPDHKEYTEALKSQIQWANEIITDISLANIKNAIDGFPDSMEI